jgi:anti-sigma factor RsiW
MEQDYRVAVAAYALGGLEPQEASELEAHLDTCPDCQRELFEFSETAAQLALVPPELVAEAFGDDAALTHGDVAADDGDLVLQRTLRQVRAERTGARRRRVLAIAAALVVLVAAPVITALAEHGNGTRQAAAPPPTAAAPAGHTVRASDPATGLTGVATLVGAPWGTKLQAKFTGEPRGEKCQLFVVSRTGEREVAANWAVTAAETAAGTNLQGSVSIPVRDIAELDVQTSTGRHLLTMTV